MAFVLDDFCCLVDFCCAAIFLPLLAVSLTLSLEASVSVMGCVLVPMIRSDRASMV